MLRALGDLAGARAQLERALAISKAARAPSELLQWLDEHERDQEEREDEE